LESSFTNGKAHQLNDGNNETSPRSSDGDNLEKSVPADLYSTSAQSLQSSLTNMGGREVCQVNDDSTETLSSSSDGDSLQNFGRGGKGEDAPPASSPASSM